ncbi:MAG: hypothetical protein KKF41_10495 [Actinobacteria bacterium]|nr:hypothetical protein [Actinomycetota bacterium]MBU1943051.1 hypothetical protein [Actinomycetota bacterium]MBU2688002.1 hypothetical protein [Actinomycetota bacterium]
MFDDVNREYMGPSKRSETWFSFLNRSGRLEVARVRELLEKWFDIFPESEDGLNKRDLLSTFRNEDDDRAVLSAFFEMYCHALLYHQGFVCEARPHTKDKNFDLLAKRNNKPEFCLECTTVSGVSNQEFKANKVVNYIYDELDERVLSPNFFLFVKVEQEGSQMPAVSRIAPRLNSWIQSLDLEEVTRQAAGNSSWLVNPPSLCKLDLVDPRGWHLTFIVIPKKENARGKPDVRPIGMESAGAKWVKFDRALRKRLEEKARRYGQLSLPYIIAVDGLDLYADEDDFETVLTGTEGIHELDNTGCERLEEVRLQNFWYGPAGPRNRKVSGVLSAVYLTPNQAASKVPLLWLNPWAEHVLNSNLWQGPKKVLRPKDSITKPLEVHAVPGNVGYEILDLDPNWPND